MGLSTEQRDFVTQGPRNGMGTTQAKVRRGADPAPIVLGWLSCQCSDDRVLAGWCRPIARSFEYTLEPDGSWKIERLAS